MELFISWSGEKSQRVASVLRAWIPCVLQGVHPFVSSQDIEAGSRWSADVAARLDDADFGLIVITRENMSAPWVNFEAGALSRSVNDSPAKVAVLLVDVPRADLKGPLTSFQNTRVDENDFRRLIEAMNALTTPQLSEGQLSTVFDKWWPDLSASLAEVNNKIPGDTLPNAARGTDDMLAEVLSLLRAGSRSNVSAAERLSESDAAAATGLPAEEAELRRKYRNLIRDILRDEGAEGQPRFLRSSAGDLIVRLPEDAMTSAIAARIRKLSDRNEIRVRVSAKPA